MSQDCVLMTTKGIADSRKNTCTPSDLRVKDEIPMIRDWWVKLIPEVRHITPDFIKGFTTWTLRYATLVLNNETTRRFYLLFPFKKPWLNYRIQCAQGLQKPDPSIVMQLSHPHSKKPLASGIGMVASDTTHAAGHVIDTLMSHFKPLFANHKLEAVLTQGMTTRGKNAMKRRGFKSIKKANSLENSGISILPVNDQWLEEHILR